MSLGAAEITFATDLFSDLPNLTTRRMFGGLALYSDGTIFALLRSDGALLIKAAEGPLAAQLAEAGATRWTYARKDGHAAAMPYWTLPDTALDDPAEAVAWARRALAALG